MGFSRPVARTGAEVWPEVYDLRVVVDEIRGFCDLPMRVGDYFEVSGGRITIPAGKFMCLWALQSIIPMLPAKQRNVVEDNDWLPRADRVSCPDPDGMVVFRIERLGEAAKEREPWPRMLVDERVCAGCRACELVCSFAHEARFSDTLSRIHVEKVDEEGIDTPQVCRQCGSARCVQACPERALSRHPETRCVVVDESLCTFCGECASACPFDSIRFHPEKRTPLICDLCGGDPQCVKRCATGAISFGRAGDRRSWRGAPAGSAAEREGRASQGESSGHGGEIM